METRRHGNKETWKQRDMKKLRHRNMETHTWKTWRHGNIETWKHGDIENGDMKTWRHGHCGMETWRQGHETETRSHELGEVDMETLTWRHVHGCMDLETWT